MFLRLPGALCATLATQIAIAPYLQAASFIGIGDLPGGAFFSQAFGISSDGSTIVGQSESASGLQAFRWTEADGMVPLGYLEGGFFSTASCVSADGTVVVGSGTTGHKLEAFQWTVRSLSLIHI